MYRFLRARGLLKTFVLIGSSALVATCTQAGVFTWNGIASKNWTGANWNEGTPNNDGSDDLHMAGNNRLVNRANGGWDINSLTFDAGASPFVISGFSTDQILIEGGGIINNSTALQTLNHPLLLNANQTWNAAAGPLSLGGSLNVFAFTLTLRGTQSIVQGGVISGNGALIKADANTVTLAAANAFSGTLTINGGTLVAGTAGALGSVASISVNNATLSLANTGGNAVNDGAPIILTGGNIANNGQSEKLGNVFVNGTDSLTLTPDGIPEVLELNTLNLSPGGKLIINGWSGVELANGQVLSTDDKVLADFKPNDNALANIDFPGFADGAQWNPTTLEITPIPEPTVMALVGVGLLVTLWRRRNH